MKSKQLRIAILLLLDEHHRTDPSRTVDDTTLAETLDVPIEEVRRQMDILQAEGLTREANTFEGHSAWISPQGMAVADEVREASEATAREDDTPRIGFERGDS